MINFSVVLLSRGRPEMLYNLINSINKTSVLRNEIIIGVDSDDVETLSSISHRNYGDSTVFVISERSDNLHTYINKIARLANGRFFLILNDDCLLVNHGWDEKSAQILNSSGKLYGRTQEDSIDKISSAYSGFPVIHRDGYDRLGFLMDESFGNHGADVLTYIIYEKANLVVNLPDLKISHLFHNSPEALVDRMEDETAVGMINRTMSAGFSVNKILQTDVSSKVAKLL